MEHQISKGSWSSSTKGSRIPLLWWGQTGNINGCKTRGILENETKSLNNCRSETDLEVFSNNSEMGLIESGEHKELLKLTYTGDSWRLVRKIKSLFGQWAA